MAEKTAIQDRIEEAFEGKISGIIAEFLGLEAADIQEDAADGVMREAAAWADAYCNNDFADYTRENTFGVQSPITILLPQTVVVGVVRYACHLYMRRVMGTKTERVGTSSDLTTDFDGELLKEDLYRSFRQWRILPGL
jgi:hypothetical protein